MGYFITNNDIFQLELTPYQYAVFSYLIRCANAKGECWPSIRKIAQVLGVSKNTVKKAIRGLEQRMLITVTRRKSDHGDQDTNLYIIMYRRDGSRGDPGGVGHVVTHRGSRGDPPPLPANPHGSRREGQFFGGEGLPIEGQYRERIYNTHSGKKYKGHDEEIKRLIRSLYVT